jgi:Ca2+-binding EF-hand superfamily protein
MKKALMLVAVMGVTAGAAFAEEPAKKEGGERRGWDPAAAFKATDTNADGAISLEEFKAGKIGQRDPAAAEDRFKKRDLDKNGSLTLAEFSTRPHRETPKDAAPKAPEGEKKAE